jgi:hypothetical protein
MHSRREKCGKPEGKEKLRDLRLYGGIILKYIPTMWFVRCKHESVVQCLAKRSGYYSNKLKKET